MKTVVFQLRRLTCPSCIHTIEKTIMNLEGVRYAKVLFHSNRVSVSFDETLVAEEQLAEILAETGFPSLALQVS